MADNNLFDKIRIGIASNEDILSWSSGEVKKPETINYRTLKPEQDGLFCQKIFGPIKDFECACGRYKKIKYKGVVCDRCHVEVTRSKVRRERMAHVELAAPVCHIWYLKGVPSPISLILDISPKQLEKVIYFAAFIVIDLDMEKIQEILPTIYKEVEKEKIAIQQQMRELEDESLGRLVTEMVNNPDEYFDEGFVRERMKANFDRIRAEYRDADERVKDLDIAVDLLGKLEINQLIEEDKWRAISKLLDSVGRRLKTDLHDLVHANIGAEAVRELLRRVDLEALAKDLRVEIRSTKSQRRARAIKRLDLSDSLIKSKSRPDWMILDVVPIISPELRPMVQLDGGRFATSDLNDLYRRIINRNNRLKRIIEIQAPESIVNHEKRLLQESVDSLIDNGRRSRPVVGSNQRALKSLSDMLKGKEGRFRKNLLGKRVDYSGRSVIVVGPHLKLHQCGLPKEMALELFKPFVMKALVDANITTNIKTAKRMVERTYPAVWDALEEVIKEHPVLLNRAPTLHRLGIQAFEPILVEGKAIQLHPLVCHAYNADFDGDQMAVHLPLSLQAQAESRVLMLASNNLFSPADGRPVASPLQDIVLGCYALTYTNKESADRLAKQVADHEAKPEKNPAPHLYCNPSEVLFQFESPVGDKIGLNDPVHVLIKRPIISADSEIDWRDPLTGIEYKYEEGKNEFDEDVKTLVPLEQEFETIKVTTTPGRLVLNQNLPYPLRNSDKFLQAELNKGAIADLIVSCFDASGTEATIKLLDTIKELGFTWATRYGISISLADMIPPDKREELLDEADEKATKILTQHNRGALSSREMQGSLQRLWSGTYDQVGKAIGDSMVQTNPLSIITVSGARGSIKQLAQLSGMRGLMYNQFNEVIYDLPVRSSFLIGLNMLEFFVTTHGARKGLADTALRTADAGYLTRRLVDVSQDVIIKGDDCETIEGMIAVRVEIDKKVLERISDRIIGRYGIATISHPETGEVIINHGDLITVEQGKAIDEIEEKFYSETASTEDDDVQEELNTLYISAGFDVDEYNLLGVKVRSPINCEYEIGICAKCYGVDLASKKLVERGVAVGIIAAQSIGEPGTQLTMRTFHTGGVAGATAIARTNQYKTGKFVRQFQEDFQAATKGDVKEFDPTQFLEAQELAVRSLLSSTEAMDKKKDKQTDKTREKRSSESKRMWERNRKKFFYAWTGESSGIVRVEEIFEARKQPRGKAIICPVTGLVADIQGSDFGKWILVRAEVPTTGPIKNAFIADDQNWSEQRPDETTKKTRKNTSPAEALGRLKGEQMTSLVVANLRKHGIEAVNVIYPINVPPNVKLPIEKGSKVIKGDRLTEGPLDPHEVLELAGARRVHEYFIENLQSVYKDQGVDINDKHLEVIIRQMLRKRQVKDPGDTPFLPGQIVDNYVFMRENEKVRTRIETGKKVKYTDIETGEAKERDPKEAVANFILLGITEASLATDSFLSAASFQKTTKILTEAAVRGKADHLIGLKENVIIGRLIPAGTGVLEYREIAVDVDQSQPSWSKQALTSLVEDEEYESKEISEIYNEMSMIDLANESMSSIAALSETKPSPFAESGPIGEGDDGSDDSDDAPEGLGPIEDFTTEHPSSEPKDPADD